MRCSWLASRPSAPPGSTLTTAASIESIRVLDLARRPSATARFSWPVGGVRVEADHELARDRLAGAVHGTLRSAPNAASAVRARRAATRPASAAKRMAQRRLHWTRTLGIWSHDRRPRAPASSAATLIGDMSTDAIRARRGVAPAPALLEPAARVLAMLSGGADSVCLVHALARARSGPEASRRCTSTTACAPRPTRTSASASSSASGSACRCACERVQLAPERATSRPQAREARYAAAEAVRAARGAATSIATGHTATDQVETVLYRLVILARPPGAAGHARRAAAASSGRCSTCHGADTRAYCREAGLAWREDETNADRALRAQPAAARRPAGAAGDPPGRRARTSSRPPTQLSEEAELLERAVDEALGAAGAGGQPPAVEAARLRELAPALRRLLLRRLAEQAAGAPLPLAPERRARRSSASPRAAAAASLDLGGGRAGGLRVRRAPLPARADAGSARAGRAGRARPLPLRRLGAGRAELAEPAARSSARSTSRCSMPRRSPASSRCAAGARAIACARWASAARKSLQDLFTDRKVPRSLRRRLPVVESGRRDRLGRRASRSRSASRSTPDDSRVGGPASSARPTSGVA